VESSLEPKQVTFETLRERLVGQVKRRINNGEFTERGLARILGISQSQTHNVLKGARRLQIQLADRILTKFGLSAMDLLSEGELDSALRLRTAEWNRDVRGIEYPIAEEFDPTEQLTPKKPVGRANLETEREGQRTG
jgi:plasmid maintenance system antidote protein VapI